MECNLNNAEKFNSFKKNTQFDPWRMWINEADNLGIAIHHGQSPGILSFAVPFINFNLL